MTIITVPVDLTGTVPWTVTEHGQHRGFVVPDMLGFIPSFLREDDPRPAAEQIDDRYAHGGGWRNFNDDKWSFDPSTMSLTYDAQSEDAELYIPLAEARLRDERILYYDLSWVAIVQPDGSYEVARLD
jgi:hypothetical protein